MNEQKQDCSDSIAHELGGTAKWRKVTAAKYPDDSSRNIRASETLNKLAADAVNLTDSQWESLKPYFGGWASETWRNGLTQVARQIGFSHRGKDLESFISVLARQMSQSTSVAA
jgi:hypothetical protein